jgi:hypothetical protein
VTSLQGEPGSLTILGNLRRFRDETMARSSQGREHIKLFYENAPEMTWLLLRNPRLRAQFRALLVRTAPTLQAHLIGDPVTVTPGTLAEISAFLEGAAAEAQPALKAQLRSVQKDLEQGKLLTQYGVALGR